MLLCQFLSKSALLPRMYGNVSNLEKVTTDIYVDERNSSKLLTSRGLRAGVRRHSKK